jgi:hypothetical protein
MQKLNDQLVQYARHGQHFQLAVNQFNQAICIEREIIALAPISLAGE